MYTHIYIYIYIYIYAHTINRVTHISDFEEFAIEPHFLWPTFLSSIIKPAKRIYSFF